MSRRHSNRNAQQDRSGHGKVKHPQTASQTGGTRMVSQKFKEERSNSILPLTARNLNQKIALNALPEKQMVILTGSAGVGKTELAVWWASKLWLEGEIDNIIITRPAEGLGRDGGAVPGSDTEKLLNYCMSMLVKFRKYLGPAILRNNLHLNDLDCLFQDKRGIQIVPLAKIQGLSFDDKTLVICDEFQNSDIQQAKALTTRCEEGCQLIICGDPKQSCKRGENGLTFIEKGLAKYPSDYVEIVSFTNEDVVRGGLASHMVQMFDNMGSN